MRRRIVGPFSVLLDALLVAVALYVAIYLRFDGNIPPQFHQGYLLSVPWVALASVVALWIAGVHRVIWRYVSLHAMSNIVAALTVTTIVLAVVNSLADPQILPWASLFVFWMLQIILVGGVRVVGRLYPRTTRWRHGSREPAPAGRRRTLIFGAGDVGETLVRDLMRGGSFEWEPVGFVDDDSGKQGRTIHGLRVLGTTPSIPKIIRSHRVDEVIIAAPSAPSTLVSSIFRCCQAEGIGCKTVPSLANYVVGKSPLQQIRNIRIEDLLGREPVQINSEEVSGFLKGRRVLVTGAGGSIGSELCRQIARFEPERLIALDHDENKLCYVSLELRNVYPDQKLAMLVGDIKDREGISRVMREHEPEVIFHAAAHKHVSFMEENPRAAILNNVLGTRIVAEEAIAHGAKKFVLISTDKAVNPTNVMGASKRLCEKIVTALAAETARTRFSSVRFGNVLGSEGSVIPIFRRQIVAGGPVTITHPEARRYFMTIPEASQLVVQAGAFGESGAVFVLDMGEQVRVIDVARQLIRLSGFEPERDIPIKITGLRPGEKLYEELLTDNERTTASLHSKIFIWRSGRESWATLRSMVDNLIDTVDSGDSAKLKERLGALVPEYRVDAPVARIDELPELKESAATRALDDRFVLPADLRPIREPLLWRTPRLVARWGLGIVGIMGVTVLAMAHAVCAPGAPVFVRESRVGRNRRKGPRRMFSNEVPIDRRGRDRRQRNLYGQPFERLRFNTQLRPGAAGLERRFYAFLRRHGLDRLPSVVHVLTGEMALVGPRPDTAEMSTSSLRTVQGYRRRFTVKPGLTGLVQVLETLDHDLDDGKRVEIDKFYVSRRSVGLDLRILARSFGVVLSGAKEEPLRFRDRLGVNAPLGTLGEQAR